MHKKALVQSCHREASGPFSEFLLYAELAQPALETRGEDGLCES